MRTHAQKWNEVCEELSRKFPTSDASLWVKGYTFGLRHAAEMAYRSTKLKHNRLAQLEVVTK